MRLKAATALLMALAYIQLSTGPLLAKPTRPLAHPAARRLIVTQPALRSSRERAAHPSSLTHSRARSGSASRAAKIPAASRSNRGDSRPTRRLALTRTASNAHSLARLHGRPRTRAQERAFAAQAAITAADRGHRDNSRAETKAHLRRSNSLSEDANRDSLPRLDDSSPSQAATEDIADSSALINVGGVLHPAPGSTLRLKSIEEEAVTPVLLPGLRVSSLYDSRGHLVVPAPLYGSREILLHQNEMADRDGLIRVQDDADLLDLRRERKLVALPDNETLRVDFRLPENRRYSRPWTAAFLTIMARDYYDSFHTPLQVDSAVRTIAVQQRLIRTNGNAAPSTGETASPHLTGQAVDIAKGGLSRTQIAWMRTYLQPLIDLGKIDVEEEFRQSCFHISVYKNFVPATSPRVSIAAARQLPPSALQEGPTE